MSLCVYLESEKLISSLKPKPVNYSSKINSEATGFQDFFPHVFTHETQNEDFKLG